MEKRNRGGSLQIGFKPSTMLKHLFLILFLVLSTAKGYSQCPISGYSYIGNFDGHHYYLSNYGTNPSLAYGDAVAAGGYLVSINSAAENAWLSPLVPGYITIGLSDLAVEGTFVWHSGEPLTYTDWWPGEPNNLGDEDYTVTNFNALGKWNDVPDWVRPQFIVEFVDSDGDGIMDVCDNCPEDPTKTEPGICGCGTSDVDSDCDGIADCNDICPGGDDSVDNNGDLIPDCSQLLNYSDYSNDWKCAANKIMVCHNGNNPHSICISKNALSAHFNHGDKIGPCTSCGNAIKVKDNYEDVQGDHDHELEDVVSETMKIVPNPVTDNAEIWLEGLNAPGIITLLDLNGKVHWQTKFAAGQNIIKLDGNLLDKAAGTYLIRLVSENRIITKYLVITE